MKLLKNHYIMLSDRSVWNIQRPFTIHLTITRNLSKLTVKLTLRTSQVILCDQMNLKLYVIFFVKPLHFLLQG